MSDVRPLRGIRYAPDGGRLDTLLSPPYDVISAEQRTRLLARDPHNIVRIDHPAPGEDHSGDSSDPYARAAVDLNHWLASGILAQDAAPAIYAVDHAFVHPTTGLRATRRGLLALLPAKPWAESPIRPHESTFSGPKRDRLLLLRATGTNTSPVFVVWDQAAGFAAAMDNSLNGEPVATATIEGELGPEDLKLWRIDAPDEVASLAQSFDGSNFYIADGHHRYETAVTYAAESGSPPFVLAYIADGLDPGLILLPTHRLISKESTNLRDVSELLTRLGPDWQSEPVSNARDLASAVAESKHDDLYVFGVVAADGARVLSRAGRDRASPREAFDVSVLHDEVLPALRISEGGLSFERDAAVAVQSVSEGTSAFAFVMAAPAMAEVIRAADAGQTIPQKSTYFYPKVPTGLVLWRPNEA